MHRPVSDLAARQYGAFTAGQALTSGVSRSTLHRWVREGRLVVLHPGIYAFAGSPASWDRSMMAATLAGGAESAASHRSAARIWELSDDDEVEITVPLKRCPRLEHVVVHRSTDLVADHVTTWRRFPVTKPARVIVDLAAVLPADKVEDVLDRALTRRLITIAGVEWMLTELSRPGRRGTRTAGRILDGRALGREPAHGQLEPRMARLLRRAGLPPARFQYRVYAADGRFLAQVDFAYPEWLLAVEVDGWETHGTPRAMGKDFVRQNGLVPHGWRVLRFTWAQVVQQPEYVASAIAQTLASLAA